MNIHIASSSFVPKTERGQRRTVTVVTTNGKFQGGIRTAKSGVRYLCPDLISEHDRSKVSLTRILKEVGIMPKDNIEVEIVGDEWVFPDRRGSHE